MAQTTRGLRSVLALPGIYTLFQTAVGALKARQRVVREYVQPRQGDRILDIGCGPGDVVGFLPDGVQYVGFDESQAYIQTARQRFGRRADFRCERVGEKTLAGAERASFDRVLALGVVHHLDDAEATELFRLAALALKPGGQLITMDGCYLPGQSRWARWMLDKDRGKYMRTREGYLQLAERVFPHVSAVIRHDLMWVPYTWLILQCQPEGELTRLCDSGPTHRAISGRQ